MMRAIRRGWWAGCLAALAALLAVPAARGQAARPPEEFHLLPLRMHLMRSDRIPDYHTALMPDDATRILGKINKIWKQAGIAFFADQVLVETAASTDLLDGLGPNRNEGHLRLIRPRASLSPTTFHVYFVGKMRPNGICFRRSPELLFVKESARLQPVRGGIDEPLPRVSAHEIGHALGLDHRQDTTNLMASGTTGTSLNDEEIRTARRVAESLEWKLSPDQALAAAAKSPEASRSRALLETLATLGDGETPSEARRLLMQ